MPRRRSHPLLPPAPPRRGAGRGAGPGAAAGAAAGLALVLVAATALAHDTWLLPARAVVPPGTELRLELTSGMAFPASALPVDAGRVATARLRLAGATDSLPGPLPGERALRFRVPLRRAGAATVWVSLAPRTLALAPAEVAGYLAEIGAPDSVRAAWRAQPAGPDGAPSWRERYAKHAKTVVRVASPLRPYPGADASWGEPTGQALELVPERDPTTLHPGDTLRVRLLRAGLPVPFHPVGVVGGGTARGRLARTDAVGRAAVVLPRAGRWLLRTTVLRRGTAPDVDWESDFATLTVAVR